MNYLKYKFKKYIICIGIFFILIIGIVAVFLIPTKDYLKMTFSEKLNSGLTARILINGDSIGGGTSQEDWCIILKDRLKKDINANVDVQNISKPGNGAFAGTVSWELLGKQEQLLSDLVIVCYGQNDYNNDNFSLDYEVLIRNIIAKNPNAEIITILESSQKEYTRIIKQIVEISNYYKIPYVDTIKAFSDSGYKYEELTDDGIHPNNIGKNIYADAVYDVIVQKLLKPKHAVDFKGERPKKKKALNHETERYENFQYFDAKSLKFKNDAIDIEVPINSILGMDVNYSKGDHGIILNKEGDSQNYYVGFSWNYNSSQRHIYRALDCSNTNHIRLSFSSIDDFQYLNGIACFY